MISWEYGKVTFFEAVASQIQEEWQIARFLIPNLQTREVGTSN
jgi:hypothetical protein